MAEGRDPGVLERECKICRRPCVKLPVQQQTFQQIPQEAIRAVVEDIARQLGACPKSPVECLEVQVSNGWKETCLAKWRAATGSIGPRGDHSEPAEWQYQMAMCSQTFEDLHDQLEQLFIGREDSWSSSSLDGKAELTKSHRDGRFIRQEDGFETKLK
ncbi:hypothetical protein E2320_002126 [Naja naja]|nr:hypothetical protein E2320_002126 [Naja naja]